ncbi:hypothetical protein [Rossellomorea sp. BNER]|uniref:Ish1 domain-containing protein n=1 Tax=Rossellomorea sp. BNER TaxID=2962031 RepID=UPI003AF2A548|nr:hypothetical protein [Rossellomorea sp. BNER]
MNRVKVKSHKEKLRIVQSGVIPPGYHYVEDYVEPVNFAELSVSSLKKVKNDELKAYLEKRGIEYKDEAQKDELIELIKK